MSITIQNRRDLAATWTAVNPVLHDGEFGIESDTAKIKLGNGVTPWNSLAYWGVGGGGAVSSVFSRSGAVVATSGDYSVGQVTGAAPLASPALTGTPTAPTATALTNSTQVATTAYADGAVATETTRATTAEALALPKTGGTMSGAIAMGANKVTGLANGASAQDATAYGQTPAGGATVTIGQGGTGQATQQAALDALAGATTSGDYLRGSGSHVAMSAILAADLPAATTSTQGAVVVDGTASDIQPAGVAAAGAKGQAADAKHVHPYQPWQFLPETYGAKGDGKVVGDVSTTSGSKVITSATAAFSSGDVGKHVMINGGNGGTSGPYIDVIASVQSETQATLTTSNAGATVTNCPMVWASDDTAAINSAITAAETYALANGYFAEVLFGPKIYGLSGLTQQSSPVVYNTQILIPYPNQSGAGQKLVIRLAGAGRADHCQFWESTTPNLSGTCLVSFRTAPSSADPTFGLQSVIGGPSAATGITGSFANTKPVLENLSVWCGAYTNNQAFDFSWVGGAHVDGYSSHIFAPPVTGTSPRLADLPFQGGFTSTIGCGGLFPAGGNNDDVTCPSAAFEGYELGFRANDHFTGGRIAVIYSNAVVGLDFGDGITSNNHMVSIQQLSAEVYNGGIRCLAGTGYCSIDVHFDAETGVTPAYDVYDNGNALHGTMYFDDVTTSRAPIIGAGAVNLKIISNQIGPGHWSGAPTVPASGTGQTNTAYRDAWVVVHTGGGVTVSAISVDGTPTGLTMAASSSVGVRVASGKTITLTYAGGTPTWDWWLD